MSGTLSREELEVLSTTATELLRSLGLGKAFRFERLSGGRNNRVYRVTGHDRSAILKWYFQHPDDPRNRLAAEYAFTEYAVACGVTCVAQPLATDVTHGFAVYACLHGRRLESGEVEAKHVQQAIDFVRDLNAYRNWSMSDGLAVASEACFSLQSHIDCVSARVERLRQMAMDTAYQRDALDFVQTVIVPALGNVVGEITNWARGAAFDREAPLRREQKCVSPSDFGFHNALVGADGQVKFFDFEYAGWDDPAKLLADFYCQPEVPAPRDTWPLLAELTAELAGDTPLERRRQALLFPLYQVKWCCILLNEFVPTAGDRRRFSEQQPADLALQLAKAQRIADQWS